MGYQVDDVRPIVGGMGPDDGPRRSLRSVSELPGPRGLPLLGSLHEVPLRRAHIVVEEWVERYGSIFSFRLGPRRLVVVADPDAANLVLRDRPGGFRRAPEAESNFTELGIHGVFSSEGEDWRRQRRLAVTALNSNHLQNHFSIVRTAAERLHTRLAKLARSGEPVDIQRELTSFTVDVTTALAFGIDLNTLERGDVELQQHIAVVFDMLGRRVFFPVPYWRWFQLPSDRALKRSLAVLNDAVADFIAQARGRLAADPALRAEPSNFLESMLVAQEEDGTYTDEEIVGNTFTLLFAGEDTTAHSMAWTLWYLAERPELQERWAAEAADVLGDDRAPSDHEVVARLPFGLGALREGIRLKSVAPVLVLEALADTTVADVRVPAGTRIWIPVRQISRETAGAEFDPERWLDRSTAPDQKSFLAFGAGPRFCPGRNLALLEATAAMAMIARHFEVELEPGAEPVSEHLGFVMVPKGLRLRLRERSPRPLQAV